MVTCNHHSKLVTFPIPFCALFCQMASASAPCLSIHRSKSNANANNNNDHQQNCLRQLRRGNCRSVSLSHLAPLKAFHPHEVRPPIKSSSTAASSSPLMDTPQDAGNQDVLIPLETPTPVPHYFAPICPVPLPPLYGLPIVQDEAGEETNGTPCKRQCFGSSK